ncbi:hypothetical protein D9756_004132 [Leucocoprinus leucothites]|uniref:RNase III domain-containing protein n=1 Tax=Leucocoprinus leucothites TaxID=201217 RepID=A0A8H5G0K8_9AGAR|nr:hypothetical protein D9756_004132 [Leucoagaricus leucothites]
MATRCPRIPFEYQALEAHPPPFRSNDRRNSIFHQLVKTMYRDNFHLKLPYISDSGWDTCIGNIHETEKLEFLGDGAIGDAVGDIVVNLRPNGTPHEYTQIKNVLTCNAFFAQLMVKLGLVNRETTKEAADVFEAIIGLFKRERGTQGVEDWAWEYFGPMVFAAWEIWDELQYVDTIRLEDRLSSHGSDIVIKVTDALSEVTLFLTHKYKWPLNTGGVALEHRAQSLPQPTGSGTKDDPLVID